MAISSDISDLSWLRQPNPGEFGLRSMQVGLEAGRSFMSAYNSGRENAREDAFMPLRQKLMQNQVANTALDIKSKMDMQDDYLMNKQAFSALSEAARRISEKAAWNDPKEQAGILEIGTRYPSVAETDYYKNLLHKFDVASANERLLLDTKTRAAKAESDSTYKDSLITLGKERNELTEARYKDISDKWQSEIKSREKLAKESNEKDLKIAGMKIAAQKYESAMDILPRAMLSKYKEEIHAIAEDPSLTPEAKSRKMDEALVRLQERRDEYEKGKSNSSEETIIMESPDGARYKVPASKRDEFKTRFKMKEISNGAKG